MGHRHDRPDRTLRQRRHRVRVWLQCAGASVGFWADDVVIAELDEFGDSRLAVEMGMILSTNPAANPQPVERRPVPSCGSRSPSSPWLPGRRCIRGCQRVVVRAHHWRAEFLWQAPAFAALEDRGDAARIHRRAERERLTVEFGSDALGDLVVGTQFGRSHEEERHVDNRLGQRRCGIPGGGSDQVSDV